MKSNQSNHDDLFDRFDTELELPQSLSVETIKQRIKDENVKQTKRPVRLLPRITAAAAAVAIVTASVMLLPGYLRRMRVETVPVPMETVPVPMETVSQPDETPKPAVRQPQAPVLSMFKDEDSLQAYFSDLYAKYKESSRGPYSGMNKTADFTTSYAEAADIAGSPRAVPNSAATDVNDELYGKTNLRTESVDEADIIKNDGRYLYAVNENELTIIDTQSMQTAGKIAPEPKDDDHRYLLCDVYVQDDLVLLTAEEQELLHNDAIVFGGAYKRAYYGYYQNASTVLFLYDTSSKSAPKLLRTVRQSGRLLQTRMIGAVLYTMTEYAVDITDKDNVKENYAPEVDGRTLQSGDILIRDKDAEDNSYLVLSAWNTADTGSVLASLSVIGCGSDLYCTDDTLYLMRSNWKKNKVETELYAFSLNGASISLKATGAVAGSVKDHYAIDQNGNYLRVTTTDYNYSKDLDVSALYVLNDKLEIVGALEDFAHDEQVKSTRFLGDFAYVVTFRNTDPLFVIDLADPKAPAILGTVKLPGFSEYLHPLTDTLLLGVGYNGDEDDADYNSVKLSLFDVSDPARPQEVDTHVIKQADTDVNYEPKAFLFDKARGAFALPVNYDITDSDGLYQGTNCVLRWFFVKDGRFADEKAFIHGTDTSRYPAFFRGTYIGDKVYTLDDVSVKEFNLQDETELRALTYRERSEEDNRTYGVPMVEYYD